jgi:hypothetical protein
MMDRAWRAILARYGQEVTVRGEKGEMGQTVRAFLQPVLEKDEVQTVPSPLGLRREDRFLYLGPADVPLTARESLVEWQGQTLEVQSAHPVGTDRAGHWWAVLRPCG